MTAHTEAARKIEAKALRDAAADAITARPYSEQWYEQVSWAYWLRDRADRLDSEAAR